MGGMSPGMTPGQTPMGYQGQQNQQISFGGGVGRQGSGMNMGMSPQRNYGGGSGVMSGGRSGVSGGGYQQ